VGRRQASRRGLRWRQSVRIRADRSGCRQRCVGWLDFGLRRGFLPLDGRGLARCVPPGSFVRYAWSPVRDARDAAALVGGVFGIATATPRGMRIGCVVESWMEDCEPSVIAGYRGWKEVLVGAGAELLEFEPKWDDSLEIFAGIQAHEAAGLHRGHLKEFEEPIAQRLAWGESLDASSIAQLQDRRMAFCAGIDGLLEEFDFLLMPSAPVSRLYVGADQSAVRSAILRYTTPASLAGLPVLALPGREFGTGVQVIGRSGADGELLGFLQTIGLG